MSWIRKQLKSLKEPFPAPNTLGFAVQAAAFEVSYFVHHNVLRIPRESDPEVEDVPDGGRDD